MFKTSQLVTGITKHLLQKRGNMEHKNGTVVESQVNTLCYKFDMLKDRVKENTSFAL